MKRFGTRKGFTLGEMATVLTVILLIALISIPVIIRIRTYINEQAIQATLLSLYEAEKSFRDAQTPTTYANALDQLTEYISLENPRYGLDFSVGYADTDTFQVVALDPTYGNGWAIDQNGSISGVVDYYGMGGQSCFIAGTPVLTAAGLQPIETIRPGDKIYSKNLETGAIELKKVIATIQGRRNDLEKVSLGNTSVLCSNNHPFFKIGGRFHKAKDLRKADRLLDAGGKSRLLKDAIPVNLPKSVPVYNLTIQDNHTYFVSNEKVLVHNNKKIGDEPP